VPVISSTRPHSPWITTTSSSRMGCDSAICQSRDQIAQHRPRRDTRDQSRHARRRQQARADLPHGGNVISAPPKPMITITTITERASTRACV